MGWKTKLLTLPEICSSDITFIENDAVVIKSIEDKEIGRFIYM